MKTKVRTSLYRTYHSYYWYLCCTCYHRYFFYYHHSLFNLFYFISKLCLLYFLLTLTLTLFSLPPSFLSTFLVPSLLPSLPHTLLPHPPPFLSPFLSFPPHTHSRECICPEAIYSIRAIVLGSSAVMGPPIALQRLMPCMPGTGIGSRCEVGAVWKVCVCVCVCVVNECLNLCEFLLHLFNFYFMFVRVLHKTYIYCTMLFIFIITAVLPNPTQPDVGVRHCII